jgi:DNA-binding NarL/FixJ family response regulator
MNTQPSHQSNKPVLTVFLVDASSLIRRMLREILALVPDTELIGEVSSTDPAILLIPRLQPDVLILDLGLPEAGHGLHLLREVKSKCPSMRVVVFTLHPREPYQERTRQAGADYFFDKAEGVAMLMRTLQQLTATKHQEDSHHEKTHSRN